MFLWKGRKLQLNPTRQLLQNQFLSLSSVKIVFQNCTSLIVWNKLKGAHGQLNPVVLVPRSFFSLKRYFLSLEFVPLRYWKRTVTSLDLSFTWHSKAVFTSLLHPRRGLAAPPDQDSLFLCLFKTHTFWPQTARFEHYISSEISSVSSTRELIVLESTENSSWLLHSSFSLLVSHQHFMVTLLSAALSHCSPFSLISNW